MIKTLDYLSSMTQQRDTQKKNETYVMDITGDLLSDRAVTLHDGTPQSFFLSDDNKLLKSTFLLGEERIVMPCEVVDVSDCTISDLDFTKMVEP
ncbi:MAG: hypothetical protein IJ844_03075 [Prevotella sp.]|nr:hypothetical protein [Prevotella sp.]